MQRRPNLTMFIFSCQIKEHDEEFSASSGNQASVPFLKREQLLSSQQHWFWDFLAYHSCCAPVIDMRRDEEVLDKMRKC